MIATARSERKPLCEDDQETVGRDGLLGIFVSLLPPLLHCGYDLEQ